MTLPEEAPRSLRPPLTAEQSAVADRIETFLRARRVERPYFVVSGLAGTGKSVLLATLAARRPGALLCAPTGKAASVLARRTGLVAST